MSNKIGVQRKMHFSLNTNDLALCLKRVLNFSNMRITKKLEFKQAERSLNSSRISIKKGDGIPFGIPSPLLSGLADEIAGAVIGKNSAHIHTTLCDPNIQVGQVDDFL